MGYSYLLDPQNKEVASKLGIATLCMFTLPIICYYIVRSYCVYQYRQNIITKDYIELYSGGAAVLMTNFIIGVYCYQAYREDLYDTTTGIRIVKTGDDDINENDANYPRVGIYKQRTD